MRKKICSCEKTDKWIRKTNEMPNVPDWPHPGAQWISRIEVSEFWQIPL